ncbi:NUDIX domain-containing protein [Streptomyces canarius]
MVPRGTPGGHPAGTGLTPAAALTSTTRPPPCTAHHPVEAGETPEAALVRELREELGVAAEPGERVRVSGPCGHECVLRLEPPACAPAPPPANLLRTTTNCAG